jgi:hypothetical protein
MIKSTCCAFLPIFFSSFVAWSQPAFQASNCFQVGTEGTVAWTLLLASYSDAVAETGDNYTWNLSSNSWLAPTGSYLFEPALESGFSTFLNSEIHEAATATFSRNLFFSYSDNNDTLYYDGLHSASSYAYQPSIPYLTFPLQFGDSIYDYSLLYGSGGQASTVLGSVSRYWIYDGYGDILFPYGTQEDVFRIRTVQIDSTFITSFATVYKEMIWFRASDGLPVLRYQDNNGLISVYYASTDSEVATEEVDTALFSLYPNPGNEWLKWTGETSYLHITDSQGRVVVNQPYTSNSWNAAHLVEGMYLVRVTNKQGKTNGALWVRH